MLACGAAATRHPQPDLAILRRNSVQDTVFGTKKGKQLDAETAPLVVDFPTLASARDEQTLVKLHARGAVWSRAAKLKIDLELLDHPNTRLDF
jgi:hypothetical protein